MTLADHTLTIFASPDVVAGAIQDIADSEGHRLVPLKAAALLVVMRGETGYVYLLRSRKPGVTELRVVVDTPETIRTVFQGRSLGDAVKALLSDPFADTQPHIENALLLHLEDVERRCDPEPEDAAPATLLPKSLLSSTLREAPPPPVLPRRTVTEPAIAAAPRTPEARSTDPISLALLAFFLTPIGAGILFGINWRRLGRPGWMLPTILTGLLLPLLVVAVAAAIPPIFPDTVRVVLIVITALCVHFGFLVTLANAQLPGHRIRKRYGSEPLARFTYPLVSSALYGMVGGLVLPGLVFLGLYFHFRPGGFENYDLSLSYPYTWTQVNPSGMSGCDSSSGFECLMIISDGQSAETLFALGRYWNNGDVDLRTFEGYAQQAIIDQASGTILAADEFTLDGLLAERHYFAVPQSTPNAPEIYGMQIYVLKGLYIYEISVESPGNAAFEAQKDAVQGIIDTIDFK